MPDACNYAFLDDPALEFSERTQQMEEEPPRGRGGVNTAVADGDELDANTGEFVEDSEQVLKASTEPIELPDGD